MINLTVDYSIFCKRPVDEQNTLKRLTFTDGLMRVFVKHCPDAESYVVRDDKGKIHGWVTIAVGNGKGKYVQTYVRQSSRKLGIGKKLLKAVLKRHRVINVFSWDQRSNNFYLKIKKQNRGRMRVIQYWSSPYGVNNLERLAGEV